MRADETKLGPSGPGARRKPTIETAGELGCVRKDAGIRSRGLGLLFTLRQLASPGPSESWNLHGETKEGPLYGEHADMVLVVA